MVRASLLVCMLVASAPSCPDLYSLATHGFTVPTLDMTTATAAPDSAGLEVSVSLTALNQNPYPISVSGIDYQLSLQGTVVFSGTQTAVAVPENGGKTTVVLGGLVGQETARGLTPGQTVSYLISGTAHVDSPAGVPVDVDFADHGAFLVPSGVP